MPSASSGFALPANTEMDGDSNSLLSEDDIDPFHELAGVEGFEPPYGGIKTRCLTAWRHPKLKNQPSVLPTPLIAQSRQQGRIVQAAHRIPMPFRRQFPEDRARARFLADHKNARPRPGQTCLAERRQPLQR